MDKELVKDLTVSARFRSPIKWLNSRVESRIVLLSAKCLTVSLWEDWDWANFQRDSNHDWVSWREGCRSIHRGCRWCDVTKSMVLKLRLSQNLITKPPRPYSAETTMGARATFWSQYCTSNLEWCEEALFPLCFIIIIFLRYSNLYIEPIIRKWWFSRCISTIQNKPKGGGPGVASQSQSSSTSNLLL